MRIRGVVYMSVQRRSGIQKCTEKECCSGEYREGAEFTRVKRRSGVLYMRVTEGMVYRSAQIRSGVQ
jgi:hypothetical protein